MKDCYYHLELHFILLDDPSQSYILKLRDRPYNKLNRRVIRTKIGVISVEPN
jgi:hypothetical protein